QRRCVAFRKRRRHRDCYARGFPARGGWNIQIDPQAIARLIINSITVKAMTLHSTADTTGKTAKHVLVLVAHSSTYRHHVTRAAVFRIHRGEDVIEQRSLFKLRVLGIRMNGEETASH